MLELLVIIQFLNRNVVANGGVVGLAGSKINTVSSQQLEKINKMGMLSQEVWKLKFRQYGQMEKDHRSAEAQTWRRSEREKMQVREKLGKSRNTVSFQCFVAAEGRKVGLLKQQLRSQLPMRDEKLDAVVAGSIFGCIWGCCQLRDQPKQLAKKGISTGRS